MGGRPWQLRVPRAGTTLRLDRQVARGPRNRPFHRWCKCVGGSLRSGSDARWSYRVHAATRCGRSSPWHVTLSGMERARVTHRCDIHGDYVVEPITTTAAWSCDPTSASRRSSPPRRARADRARIRAALRVLAHRRRGLTVATALPGPWRPSCSMTRESVGTCPPSQQRSCRANDAESSQASSSRRTVGS